MAEVTGRSRRIVAKVDGAGDRRLAVESRAGSANLAETQAFQDDEKRILVFSDAGGTGRSYHADLGARNRRLRVHYLLEAGWKADTAIQGLGRTNRTNQAQPPLFRPIATDVKAEKRFLSTIARRLDTLGAITKGQRQTGGQGLFRPEDNLESVYARAALRQLYVLLYAGKVEGCSLQRFEDATGLTLTDRDGTLKEELPPISQFLNRLLALTIDLQNTLFAAFEALLEAKIEGAIASGTYDVGVETIAAASLSDRRAAHDLHPSGHRRGDAGVHHRPARPQRAAVARRRPGARREAGLPAAPQRQVAPCGRAGAGAQPHARRRHASSAASGSSGLWSVRRSPSMRWRRPRGGRPTLRRSRSPGRPSWPSSPSSGRARCTSSPACCCPIWRQLPNDGGRVYRLQTDEPAPELAKGQHPGASASSAARCRRPGSQRPARRRRSSRPRTPSRA